jgi:polyisoprenoid-binding protein YceI
MNWRQKNIQRGLRFVSPWASMLGIALALTACHAPPTKPTAPITPAATGSIPTEITHYRIESSSLLHILVYRGGPLARLGHNHVISSHDLQGTLAFNPQLGQSNFTISLPVQKLTVDEASERAMEGEDFSAAVPDDAREGTRGNLLRAEVLDGEHFPTIALQSLRINGTPTTPILTLLVTLKASAREVIVPVQVAFAPQSLTASGEFAIKQTDFGITPFSIGMGALQVRDEVRIRFRIDASVIP